MKNDFLSRSEKKGGLPYPESKIWGLLIGLILTSCNSSHKLTGTNYVDLSTGEAINQNSGFPQELADSLGWGDLTSGELKISEEFRFSLKSEFEPYHLFRVSVGRNTDGAGIMYWPKTRTVSLANTHENMEQYLKGKCTEFFETQNFEYCEPTYETEPNWGSIYSTFESRDIWKIPDQSELETENQPDSIRWVLDTQVRLRDYYRSYTHTNPEKYPGSESKINLLAIIAQLHLVSAAQEKAENFNIYYGVTTGERSSAFKLCDESETWRFDGNLEELLKAKGYPVTFEETEQTYFYVTVLGTVDDEWYGNRGRTGFTKVIRPTEINDLVVLKKNKCPSEP